MEGLKKVAAIALFAATLCTFSPVAHAEEDATNSWTGYVSITDGCLNVRRKPGCDTSVIGKLDAGDSVTVTGRDGNWLKIDAPFEESIGYVKAEYITNDLEAVGSYVNTSGGRVRIRSGINGSFVAWLKAGKTVQVQSWNEDKDGTRWAFIGKGWVRGDCLTRAVEGE